MVGRETKRVLITVRTYPTPAKHGIEVSCTAGIVAGGSWIRLYPVPYRFLEHDQRFQKYQWIDVDVIKAKNDPRPESFKIVEGSIRLVGKRLPSTPEWRPRWDVIRPHVAHCLCCLKRARDSNGHPTLGLFKPRSIERLKITPDRASWTQEELELLRQGTMFGRTPSVELEKVPFKFQYLFHCDHDECPGHRMECHDWEMLEAWRKWRRVYGAEWQPPFKERFESEMIHKRDTHFYVGTHSSHPGTWMIVGLFYPPKPRVRPNRQGELFG